MIPALYVPIHLTRSSNAKAQIVLCGNPEFDVS